MVFPDELPRFAAFKADRANNVWVQHYDTWTEMPGAFGPSSIRTNPKPTTWDVFDPQGRWVTSMTLPASFTPVEIGASYVAGVWRDADDVEHVRFYRLLKP